MMRPQRLSIRTRLTLWYAAVFAVTGGVLLTAVYLLARRELFSANAELTAKVGVIAATPANPAIGTGESPMSSTEAASLPPAAGVGWAPDVYQAIDRARDETLRAILVQSGIVFAVTAVLALVLCWFIASRALRPLRTITSVAGRLSHETLEDRIPAAGPRDELSTLADTFNRMLDRLGHAFQAQKLFAANASHELRTPLTIIQAAAEQALSRPHRTESEYRKALTSVVAAAHRSERLLAGLLTLAQVSRPAGLDRLDLADAAADGTHTMPAAGTTVRADLAPAPLTADPVLLGLLIRNLLENATRYNVDGGTVWVSTRGSGDTAVLEVANTGPPVAADTVPALRRAFQRGSRRTGGSDGFGLGLAIVDAIVDAHDGDWTATPRTGGGLTVTVRLPAGD